MKKSKELDTLQPNPRNPRKITEENKTALARALVEFGDLSGIIKNVTTDRLVGGHQRLQAFKSDKDAKIVVQEQLDAPDSAGTTAWGYISCNGTKYSYREVQWDEKKEIAANLRANNPAGEFERDDVIKLLQEIQDDVDLPMTGFTEDQLTTLLQGFDVLPIADVPFDKFGDAVNPDGSINFHFGDFKTKVRKEVYESFSEHVKARQKDDAQLLIDDIIDDLVPKVQ